jgi:hypothetical protein
MTVITWNYPLNPAGTNGDDRGLIVGRWTACGARFSNLPAHDAIEFGANGRWRLLAIDATAGTFSPIADAGEASGFYQLLGIGQLNLQGESPSGGLQYLHIAFADGMDALSFTAAASGPIYARSVPSPLNGADNPPPTSAGSCSMVGDWDVPSGGTPTVFSFDAAGNFVAGGAATLCDGRNSYGTYALSDGLFQLTTNVGLGCTWWYGASFSATFDPSCTQLSLTRVTDTCTGGRVVFNMPTTITRRAGPAAD